MDAERAALLATLTAQREHVLGILDGLDDNALRRAVLPSGWTCLGLVHHLAVDVEEFWFRAVVAGEQAVTDRQAGPFVDAWQIEDDRSAAEVLAFYRDQIIRADAILRVTPLDQGPRWWPESAFGDWRIENVREILLHVIAETACHAGHLDAAREILDGRQWMVLTA